MKRIAAAAALAATFAFPAHAAPNCASTEDVVEILTLRFAEEPVARGLDQNGNILLWWANVDTGSWTLTVTRGDQTCVVADGAAFERLALQPNV